MIILKDKKDKRLNVTRLCQIAGVSRTAFYRNYRCLDDVLVDEIEVFGHLLLQGIGKDVYNNWLYVFQSVEQRREDLEAIVEAGFEAKILEVFLSLLPEEEDNRTIQWIWVSLFHTMMIKWLKEKKPKKAEEMAAIAYKYTKNIPLVALE